MTGAAAPAPVRVVYLIGAGHCGSTLLDICLDAHPQIMGLGEITTLAADNPAPVEHPAWVRAAEIFRSREGRAIETVRFRPQERRIRGLLANAVPSREWQAENVAALRALADGSGAPLLADSSKEWQRLLALANTPGIDLRVIHIVRDARGVINSYRRKYSSWRHGYRRLMKIDLSAMFLQMRRIPRGHWHRVRYEDLASRPEETLRGIAAFLDLPFDPAMLSPDPSTYSGIGGNRMRNRRFEGFSLDEGWRRELSAGVAPLVSLASLPHNLRHGYSLAFRRAPSQPRS